MSPARSLAMTLMMGLGSVASAAAIDGQPTLQVDVVGWNTRLNGDWLYQSPDAPPGSGDITAASVDANQRRWALDADVHLSGPHFEVFAGGFAYKNKGDSVAQTTTYFGNATFPTGSGIHADVRLDDGYLGIAYKPLDISKYSFAIGVSGHVLSGHIMMESQSPNAVPDESDSLSETKPCPAVYGRFLVGPFAGVSADVTAQWISLKVSDATVKILDAEAGVTYVPWEYVGIRAGYKYFKGYFDITKDQEKKLDAKIAGPFVGLTFEF